MLFELLNVTGDALLYFLGTCAGITEVSSRKATGLVVAPLIGSVEISLPILMECNQIPIHIEETPPAAAFHHSHLRS